MKSQVGLELFCFRLLVGGGALPVVVFCHLVALRLPRLLLKQLLLLRLGESDTRDIVEVEVGVFLSKPVGSGIGAAAFGARGLETHLAARLILVVVGRPLRDHLRLRTHFHRPVHLLSLAVCLLAEGFAHLVDLLLWIGLLLWRWCRWCCGYGLWAGRCFRT